MGGVDSQSAGTDRGKVGSGVLNVLLLNLSGEGLQDLQDLIAVATLAEKREGKVQGHGMMSGWVGKGQGSGSDQQVVLPGDAIREQQVRDCLQVLAVLICLQDGSFALGSDLINGDGAVGGGVVAHRFVCG